MINRPKEEYQNHIDLKLNDPMTATKTYWSILKTFYNGKKVSIIPPLLINDKLISDFEVRANHFNDFFASQYTHLDNSKISESQTYITNTKLSSIKFENKDIINISKSRASKIRNFGTGFFVHLITYLPTRSCTSHFVHLK